MSKIAKQTINITPGGLQGVLRDRFIIPLLESWFDEDGGEHLDTLINLANKAIAIDEVANELPDELEDISSDLYDSASEVALEALAKFIHEFFVFSGKEMRSNSMFDTVVQDLKTDIEEMTNEGSDTDEATEDDEKMGEKTTKRRGRPKRSRNS